MIIKLGELQSFCTERNKAQESLGIGYEKGVMVAPEIRRLGDPSWILIYSTYDTYLMAKKNSITDINIQDSFYLSDFLLNKGYEIHKIGRREESFKTGRIDHLMSIPLYSDQLHQYYGDFAGSLNFIRLLSDISYDRVCNLALQRHMAVSIEFHGYTADVDAIGNLRKLMDVSC